MVILENGLVNRPVAVADGDERKSHLVKITHAVVSNIPTQHAITDLIVLMAGFFPVLRCHMAERRQITAVFGAHGLQFF